MRTPIVPFPPATTVRRLGLACTILAVAAGGCTSPLAVQSERDLRRSVMDSAKRELVQAQQMPAVQVTTREPGVERLQIKPELIPELERMAGPGSYDKNGYPMDTDLLGQPQRKVPVTLEHAMRSAAQNNLQVEFARLQPAVSEAQVVAAEAAFDFTLFSNTTWQNQDEPRAQTISGGIPSLSPVFQQLAAMNSSGLKRTLPSGGQISFQQDMNYTDINTPGGIGQRPNPAKEVDWTLELDQPLLRNFGSDINLSMVRLNRNAERDAIASLKRTMIQTLSDTERDYWQLAQSQRNLLILQRLYERGIATRDQIVNRFQTVGDVTAAQVADARARVERRLADVLRGQEAFRAASDTLKLQLNDADIPVGGEELLVPVDDAPDAPVSFSLSDVLSTAIRSRPEVQQSILSIDNTSIRQEVADNARLPRLDLRLQTRLAGLSTDYGHDYRQIGDTEFVDYLVGLQFEQPLGNRAAEAQYRQRRLERMQATIAYRFTIQQVVLEVKRALRQVVTNYKLIEQTRVARFAQTENLRSFEVEKAIFKGSTIEQLDLEFQFQEELASSEQDEVTALVNYSTSLAQLYAAMGTILEHNNIIFNVPNADEPLSAGGLNSATNPEVPVNPSTPALEPRDPRFVAPWKDPNASK